MGLQSSRLPRILPCGRITLEPVEFREATRLREMNRDKRQNERIMKSSRLSRMLSLAMFTLGLGGAIYSAIEWRRGPASSSVKYEILFVMWLVLGIGWGSRLLPNRAGE